jgi:hypothetical protein
VREVVKTDWSQTSPNPAAVVASSGFAAKNINIANASNTQKEETKDEKKDDKRETNATTHSTKHNRRR